MERFLNDQFVDDGNAYGVPPPDKRRGLGPEAQEAAVKAYLNGGSRRHASYVRTST